MKNTFQCPKCSSTRVIRIEGQRLNQNQVISLNRWSTQTAVLDRYLCTSCGFTEEWIQIDSKFSRWVERNKDKGNFASDFV
jgi:predicted nucleic-acid-binding Zn-ribbon protein